VPASNGGFLLSTHQTRKQSLGGTCVSANIHAGFMHVEESFKKMLAKKGTYPTHKKYGLV
jgi:hypothetical protein